jgi:succinate dehydrogenase / fumarate reductase, cytochrome b subunit
VTNKRPVNLDIGTIKLPVTAYASILHRITGVALFFVVGILLYILDASLSSPEGFADIKECLSSPLVKLVLWGCLAAISYHIVAGIRHMIMDLGIGETLEGGKTGAKLVFVCAVVLILIAGAWIW